MRHNTGLTLVEWIVTLLAIGGLAAYLLFMAPRCNGPRGRLVARARCAGGLKAISCAFAMYAEDPTREGRWPWINGTDWDSPTGTNFDEAPPAPGDPPDARAISSLMFLLVRERGVTVQHFACPGDRQVAPQEDADLEAHWDFQDAQHVSYSYAAALATRDGGWSSGADPNAVADPALLAVLADKTPATDGRVYPVRWGPDISEKDRRKGMSPNHDGEAINIVYLDYHVGREVRADVGIDRDCIYTAGGAAGPSRTAMSTRLSDHVDPRDSFLVGPYGRR